MKEQIRNPHPFDMSSYYTGLVCVLGGADRKKDKKENSTQRNARTEDSYKLDWSFLKKNSRKTRLS
jgi:hypothetical protein